MSLYIINHHGILIDMVCYPFIDSCDVLIYTWEIAKPVPLCVGVESVPLYLNVVVVV